MLRRKIYDKLLAWRSKPAHKALLIKGQRRVGKTYIVREFARAMYRHFVELDLGTDTEARNAFRGNLRVDDIVGRLSAMYGPSEFVPGETLLFFDNVHEFSPAWSSLKAFTEDGRFDVIATVLEPGLYAYDDGPDGGRLLPTGYQRVLEMGPLDFEEYLWASGITVGQTEAVVGSLVGRKETDLHDRLTGLFREYMFVGGMPEVVSAHIGGCSAVERRRLQEDIRTLCRRDIRRYVSEEGAERTVACYDSVSDGSVRYLSIGPGEEDGALGLLWLGSAGLVIGCHVLSRTTSPLLCNTVPGRSRVYLPDTGLSTYVSRPSADDTTGRNDQSDDWTVLENLVAVCLDRCGFRPCCYGKNDGMPDPGFIIETMSGTVAVNVGPGTDLTVDHKVVLEDGRYRMDRDGTEHFPLYAVAFFDRIWNGDGTL